MFKVSVFECLLSPFAAADGLNKGNRGKLTCEYRRPERHHNSVSASASDRSWYGLHSDNVQADVQSLDFPTMLFLDPGILQHGQVEVYQAASPVAEHILHLLGDIDDVRATASNYFEHIHSWMPFISKKRFYDLYLPSPFQSRSDVVLLLLSLKLITTLPPTSPRNPRTPLYHAMKHFHLQVEGSSIFSLPVLQAAVLLALYEVGHAIYPAAFLSVGACARYAHALGIGCSESLQIRRVLTLVEVEERRKTWWAIVILDRLVPSSFYPLHDNLGTIIGLVLMTIVASLVLAALGDPLRRRILDQMTFCRQMTQHGTEA